MAVDAELHMPVLFKLPRLNLCTKPRSIRRCLLSSAVRGAFHTELHAHFLVYFCMFSGGKSGDIFFVNLLLRKWEKVALIFHIMHPAGEAYIYIKTKSHNGVVSDFVLIYHKHCSVLFGTQRHFGEKLVSQTPPLQYWNTIIYYINTLKVTIISVLLFTQ